MTEERVCRDCGETYAPFFGKPGLITQCADCGRKREVPIVKGFTVADSKVSSYVVPMRPRQFDELTAVQRRNSVRNH